MPSSSSNTDNSASASNQPEPNEQQDSSTSTQPSTEPNQTSTNDTSGDANRYNFDSTFVTALNALFQRQAAASESTNSSSNTNANSTNESQPLGQQSDLNNLIDDAADSGAIVITINYVFSDENNPSNPNRSGSLVLTLPNNPSNRNPRILDEFIRLATQIAYTAIVNGMQPEKKGITVKKFKSFPIIANVDLGLTECSICLEDFEQKAADKEQPIKTDIADENPTPKRRKVNTNSDFVRTGIAQDEPPVDRARQSQEDVEFLKDCTMTFPHVAVELPCKHVFGQSCLAEWLKSNMTCPLCRTAIKDEVAEINIAPQPVPTASNTPNVRVVDRSGEEIRFLLHNNASQGEHRIYRAQVPPVSTTASASAPTSNTAASTRTRSLGRQSIFNNIRDYFRSSEINEPLFPTSVVSRRTATGVNTTTTEGDDDATSTRVSATMAVPVPRSTPGAETQAESVAEEVLDFLNLRSLTDDNIQAENNGHPNQGNDTTESNNSNRNSSS